MKLIGLEVENFGSYPNLGFDFDNKGLSLIYGPTGAGKSTILDAVCWVLYGITAKEGNADEVRSWQTPDEPTTGSIKVEVPSGTLFVCRTRGKGKNDLYWVEEGSSEQVRGKDLVDTQKELEKRLGVSAELYLTGAYFHEFSSTGLFFSATAKDRRAVFEKIANLELPAKLATASSEQRKKAKADLSEVEIEMSRHRGAYRQLSATSKDLVDSVLEWEEFQKHKLEALQVRKTNFDVEKDSTIEALLTKADAWAAATDGEIETLISKIERLDTKIQPKEKYQASIENCQLVIKSLSEEKCSKCGGPNASDKVQAARDGLAVLKEQLFKNDQLIMDRKRLVSELDRVNSSANPFLEQLQQAKAQVNTYDAQIAEAKAEVNPYQAQLEKTDLAMKKDEAAFQIAEANVKTLKLRLGALNHLYDLSSELRGVLLLKAVQEVEASTNRYLERYFDAELRVGFALTGADSLNVTIQKSGYECVYRQLSKGQRGLLKLCFVISIMQAASNKAGVHFDNLFFDEALDGLDADLKVKAFGLFQELEKSHSSILLIDHAAEFQSLFSSRFKVELDGDASSITEENE